MTLTSLKRSSDGDQTSCGSGRLNGASWTLGRDGRPQFRPNGQGDYRPMVIATDGRPTSQSPRGVPRHCQTCDGTDLDTSAENDKARTWRALLSPFQDLIFLGCGGRI